MQCLEASEIMALLGLVEQGRARMKARRVTTMNTTHWRRRHWERRTKPSREWGELQRGATTVPTRLWCWLTSSLATVGLTAATWRLVQDGSCKEEDGIVKPWFWCSEEERNKASGMNPPFLRAPLVFTFHTPSVFIGLCLILLCALPLF